MNERTRDISLSDAHAHLNAFDSAWEIALRLRRNILTCFSIDAPEEWVRMERILRELAREGHADTFLLSFGIHPWKAADYEPRKIEGAYERCAAIGEIGIDTVWCKVPLARQSAVFEEQLQLAADLHKPIVLHTKGAESRIADMVEGFPEPILVHWYSGPLGPLERFAEQRCYFTLGPDCPMGSELSCTMMTSLPLDRLLVETDGIEGVRWAIEEEPLLMGRLLCAYLGDDPFIEPSLTASILALAQARGIAAPEVALRLRKNMERFYRIS